MHPSIPAVADGGSSIRMHWTTLQEWSMLPSNRRASESRAVHVEEYKMSKMNLNIELRTQLVAMAM